MENVKPDLYYTKDLSEAAALHCHAAKLLRLEKELNFYWFVFSSKSFCEQLSNSYWAGQLQVSAKNYTNSLRELKDRLFARR